jgi:hypothetical protein
MDFYSFVMKKNTYSLAIIHPIFAYKCALAIVYWLDKAGIEYEQTQTNDSHTINIKGGAVITSEDIGEYICFDYHHSYPKKIDIYRCDLPVMLCTSDDDLDEIYLSRFAPGLHTLIGDYRKLDGLRRYVVCSDEVMIMLRKWIDVDNKAREPVDVLFIAGSYNAKDIATNVMFGKELVVLEYEVELDQSIRLTKSDIVITIENENVIVNGVKETI